jgi:hypothetical protein
LNLRPHVPNVVGWRPFRVRTCEVQDDLPGGVVFVSLDPSSSADRQVYPLGARAVVAIARRLAEAIARIWEFRERFLVRSAQSLEISPKVHHPVGRVRQLAPFALTMPTRSREVSLRPPCR